MQYYYLATSLPPLEFASHPTIDFETLVELYRMNLTKSDLKKLEELLIYLDLLHVKPFLRKLGIDGHGALDEKELEEALIQRQYFPESCYEHLKPDESQDEIAHGFPRVLSAYFKDKVERSEGFVKRYLMFEWQYRLVTAGFRAKRSERDLNQELRFEDALDPFVADILKQKESTHFESPSGFSDLIEILVAASVDPLKQYKLIEEFRFDSIRQMAQGEDFSIDYLLAYLVMLVVLEDIYQLDKAKGMDVLNKEIRDIA